MTAARAKVRVALAGVDGNALALLGTWRNAARNQGWVEAEIDAVSAEAMRGDYTHVLATLCEYTDADAVFGCEEDEFTLRTED